ncbi:MAG: hypothetical protein IT276_11075 [Ignavibacteriaceae bacterium]|nr:hypothetical protein [Ignavibacteriaceae bacterium]HMN26006.1 hypothetical protein [Ignavibacteriaceae bacterium]HRN24923.1 hypothetical protein [Ignavibacteriaceae bacterium]HRP93061.1 hypothetical protein [Ignavibacteriaceae bacterium]
MDMDNNTSSDQSADKNQNEENEKDKTKKPSRILGFIFKHKMFFTLLLIIAVILVYHMIRINSLESEFAAKTVTLKKEYTLKIDSMKIANLQQTIKVFSWAVRSELNRSNLEEVNQFFLNFVKEKGIRMISLVNPENGIIILSTNKKNEGNVMTDKQIMDVTDLKVFADSTELKVVVPIMGLNIKNGVLIVEVIK